MSKETKFIKPIISTVDTEELLAIHARKDVDYLYCQGKGVHSFIRRLIPSIRAGRIGGTLIFCRISYGKDSGLNLGNIRRLLIPFSDISQAQWLIFKKSRDFIEAQYVFKKDETTVK